MNIFRAIGDLIHVLSFAFLLWQLHRAKSAEGVSLKSLELYLLVFVTRYLDLFFTFHSLYNSCMKVLYIALTAYMVYLLRQKEPWKTSYINQLGQDDIPHWKFLALPCAVLALVINDAYFKYGFLQYIVAMLWSFSEYMEALAIFPQLRMLQKQGEAQSLTSNFVFCLGLYRLFYIFNWIYRFYHEPHYSAWIAWVSGVVQTGLYADFFYYYVKSKMAGLDKVPLPQ